MHLHIWRAIWEVPPPPAAAKSQDAKNKDVVKKYVPGSYFQSHVK